MAVFGSIFASSYAPRIINAFRSLPIPAGPKAEAHQSMAAALAVVRHAPRAARPFLENVAFNAFHSGVWAASIAGAVVAAVGAVAAFTLLPGRPAVVRDGVAGAVGAHGGGRRSAETGDGRILRQRDHAGAGVRDGRC